MQRFFPMGMVVSVFAFIWTPGPLFAATELDVLVAEIDQRIENSESKPDVKARHHLRLAAIGRHWAKCLASPGSCDQSPIEEAKKTLLCAKWSYRNSGRITDCLGGEENLRLYRKPHPVTGPSFSCGKSSTSVEKKICASKELTALDLELSDIFQDITGFQADKYSEIGSGEGFRKVKTEQQRWLKERNNCKSSYNVTGCLSLMYKKRIAELDTCVIRNGSERFCRDAINKSKLLDGEVSLHYAQSDLHKTIDSLEVDKTLAELMHEGIKKFTRNSERCDDSFDDCQRLKEAKYSKATECLKEKKRSNLDCLRSMMESTTQIESAWLVGDQPISPRCFIHPMELSSFAEEFVKFYDVTTSEVIEDSGKLYGRKRKLPPLKREVPIRDVAECSDNSATPLMFQTEYGGSEVSQMFCDDGTYDCERPLRDRYTSLVNSEYTCSSVVFPTGVTCLEIRRVKGFEEVDGSAGGFTWFGTYALVKTGKRSLILWMGEKPVPKTDLVQ